MGAQDILLTFSVGLRARFVVPAVRLLGPAGLLE
jgi:hypothetical protein